LQPRVVALLLYTSCYSLLLPLLLEKGVLTDTPGHHTPVDRQLLPLLLPLLQDLLLPAEAVGGAASQPRPCERLLHQHTGLAAQLLLLQELDELGHQRQQQQQERQGFQGEPSAEVLVVPLFPLPGCTAPLLLQRTTLQQGQLRRVAAAALLQV
jgi:hypothetical protein